MRIATWNVNGLRARLDFVALWLRERQPDLVGFQELKLDDAHFPHPVFESLGYRAECLGQKGWNGVAVLSRQPIRVTGRGLPGQESLGARLLAVEAEGLSFTTVYVPNGKSVDHEDFPRKLAWLDALAAHFESSHSPDAPALLCGDFNVVPAAIDSWSEAELAGEIFHTDAERERLARLGRWGLCDLYRELRPGERAFSWWDYRGGAFHRGHGLRIDLVLATGSARARAQDARIDRDWRKKHQGLVPSDHAPVVVDLD